MPLQRRDGEGTPEWMTLGRAAETLGVSDSTVRRWVDAGELHSFRTKGGHRRVLGEDVEALMADALPKRSQDPDHVSAVATARVRRRLVRRPSESVLGLGPLSDSSKARLRLLGHHLVDLFAHYVTARNKKSGALDEARKIGHEYGRLMVEEEVRLSGAIAAFNSLRRSLEETASQIATEQGLGVDETVEAVEAILDLADVVLEGMAEQYETMTELRR